jgi:branched-chain amino acid transport system permease protein
VTKGANGISDIPRPPAIPLPFGSELAFTSQVPMYYLILFFLVLIALINNRLVHSLVGRTFIAISWDEDLAQSIGVNIMRRKLLSFTISAIYTGVAGVLYASYNSVITPHLAHFIQGMNSVVFLVVGGAATMAGPFVGTLVMMAVPEALQVLPILKITINGFVLLIFIIFLPAGMVGGFRLLVSRLRRPERTRIS